jgi:hypothetical protein
MLNLKENIEMPARIIRLVALIALSFVLTAAQSSGGGIGEGEDGDSPEADQEELIEALEAIGYLGGTEAPVDSKTGITIHDEEKAYQGLNLFCSGHAPEAYLSDMHGNDLHVWRRELSSIWPNRVLPEMGNPGAAWWRRVYLYENGDLLAIFEGIGLVKLDAASNILWAYSGLAHHDLEILDNGDIYILERKAHIIPRINSSKPVLEDFITILDKEGKVKRKVSLLSAFENSEFQREFDQRTPRDGDVFHTNTLERFDGRHAARSPFFKEGNILLSMKRISTIAIIDMEKEEIVWQMLGPWVRQHQPTLLDRGTMLIFDNNSYRGGSRVLEFEPFTGNVLWTYAGTPSEPIFSRCCGSNQLLPNNNILITESEHGRVIEVTPEKEIVWEYRSPYRYGEQKEKVALIGEMVRLAPDFPLDWLQP